MPNEVIYLIGGLGADERIFQRLSFGNNKVVFIHWVEPFHGEDIAQYAKRLSAQILTNKPIVIGVSFGGIMAIEIAKQLTVLKTIVISSAKIQAEIPFLYRALGYSGALSIFPVAWLTHPSTLVDWAFGVTSPADRRLLHLMLRNTSPAFLKWALNAITTWKNHCHDANVFSIHGSADRILPHKYVRADVTIIRGGHFMVFNRAAEISKLLETLL